VRVRAWLRRRWRGLAASTVVVVVALVSLGWWFSRFPADGEPVAGTPFELAVQREVPAAEVDLVRTGLTAMDRYLRSEVGVSVDGPVQVRVSWSRGCRFYLGPQSVSTAWADGPDFICLNAAHRRWRSSVEGHAYFPAYVAAHEHVHNLQAQLGCYRDTGDHEWQWLFEGTAVQLAFAALVEVGIVSADEVELAVWEYRGLQVDNGTLRDYERSSDAAGDAYGLFHLGARVLAERAESPAAFADFCRATGRDVPWRKAFAEHFGITVAELYDTVEAERVRLRPEYDCAEPPCRSAVPPAPE